MSLKVDGDHVTEIKPAEEKSLEQWRELLTGEQFSVMFKEGTEPPGSSALNREKRKGTGGFLREALFTLVVAKQNLSVSVRSSAKVITFCRKDIWGWTHRNPFDLLTS